VDIGEFDYVLPAGQIAQTPVEPRDSARLMVDRGPTARPNHLQVRELDTLVGPGDVVVVNNTRVIAARLALRKSTGGAVEVFLLEALGDGSWSALVKPSRRVPVGAVLEGEAGEPGADLSVVVGDELGAGSRQVEVSVGGNPIVDAEQAGCLDGVGATPLPPYIHAHLADPERYQTVYAHNPGSVAAPTAGLHLTPELLGRMRGAGASIHSVELTVGIDTFRPVLVDDTDDHVMHSEAYAVSEDTLAACREAQRVIAVGTTTVRALESAAAGRLTGRTSLFIQRGYQWRIVDAMMTNFHMPRSTLLVMIDAFVGDRWRSLYKQAIDDNYRMLSFGDAMFLTRDGVTM